MDGSITIQMYIHIAPLSGHVGVSLCVAFACGRDREEGKKTDLLAALTGRESNGCATFLTPDNSPYTSKRS